MRAEIFSIGTELLLGETVNTNATYIAGQLPHLGLDLLYMTVIGDNHARLVDSLKQAWQRADVIITTGGLGPTQDDITRESIAELMGETMTIDPSLLRTLEIYFSRLNREMSQNNRKQATLIPSARAIINERGTAPGWWVEKNGKVIIAMPGPPGEMKVMWTEYVFPELQNKLGESIIASRTLKTYGLGEGNLDQMIGHVLNENNPSVGVYAKYDGIHLRITAKAHTYDEVYSLIDKKEKQIIDIIGTYIWGKDEDTLEKLVESLLLSKGQSLSTMETFTDGFLAHTLNSTMQNGVSYKGGITVSSPDSLELCGVSRDTIEQYGIVSPETTAAMAQATRERFKSTIGLGITSTWSKNNGNSNYYSNVSISICDSQKRKYVSGNYNGQRQKIKQRGTVTALVTLMKFLSEED